VEAQRVLIIDDDPALLESLSAALCPSYRVHTARNAAAALADLTVEPVDLVLLDLCLGDEDGAALLPEIRKRTSAPVLLMTGYGTRDNLIQSIRARPDDFLEKPFAIAELQTRMSALLGKRRTLDERLGQVRSLLAREYAAPLTLAGLAREAGMSPRELREAFTRRFGETPTACLLARRMDEAARLVANGFGLKEIAVRVGYRSASNLSAAFRRHFGIGPRAYRERRRAQGSEGRGDSRQ
jgi:DNA-binding response OmpR family regulator